MIWADNCCSVDVTYDADCTLNGPAIDYAELLRIHKLYDWAVNINTVKHSETMFAARVYELQAMGNLLISNDRFRGMTVERGRIILPDAPGLGLEKL